MARADLKDITSEFLQMCDSVDCDLENQAGPSFIGDHQIGPSAEDEERPAALGGQRHRHFHIVFTGGFDKIPGRTPYFEGGERGQRNVFLNQQCFVSDYTAKKNLEFLICKL